MRLPLVERLGALPEAAREAIVDERVLEDLLEGVLDGHGTARGGRGGDLDLLGGDVHGGTGVGSSVRHLPRGCTGQRCKAEGLLPTTRSRTVC